MKALVKEKPAPGIAYRDFADPQLSPGHVIVKVRACGISGSEVARYRWTPAHHAGGAKDMTRHLPCIMGHEFTGTVVAAARDVIGVRENDPVVIQSAVGCGRCDSCDAGIPGHCTARRSIGVHLPGGLAELVAVPAPNVYAIPADVPLASYALVQPFAIATYAVELAGIKPGDRIGVWGPGQIGLSIVQAAQLCGASVEFAVGRSSSRLDAARALGVKRTISVDDGDAGAHLRDLYAADKLDVVFEASGNVQAVVTALPILKKRGKVLVLGNLREPLHVDLLQAIMDQLSILTLRTFSLSAWRRALAVYPRVMDQQQALFPTTRVPLADGVRAFEAAAAGGGAKFVVEP